MKKLNEPKYASKQLDGGSAQAVFLPQVKSGCVSTLFIQLNDRK